MSGKAQATKTPTAKARRGKLDAFYGWSLPPERPGDFAFHLDLIRPHLPAFNLDSLVDSLQWDDEQSGMTGSFTGYRGEVGDPTSLPVARGHRLRCRVRWAGVSYELWQMRCKAPQIEVETGLVSVDLEDDMAQLNAVTQDWHFRATKRWPYGYRLDEIAAAVARAIGVKLNSTVRGTFRQTISMKNSSATAVLQKACANEKARTKQSYVIRMRNGGLEIAPLRRNLAIYVLGPEIQTALITKKAGNKLPTTALFATGHTGSGRHTRSLRWWQWSWPAIRAFGYVYGSKDFGKVGSMADLKWLAWREQAKRLALNDTISITHAGIPFIRRGDGANIALAREGYWSDSSWVYCTRASHTVQSATYTTQWDFNATDPYGGKLPTSEVKSIIAQRQKAAQRARPKLTKAR